MTMDKNVQKVKILIF